MKTNENGDFDSSSSDARMLFKSIQSFEFIACLVLASNILHHTLSLTVQLQQRNIDVVKSLKHINLLKTRLQELQDSVDQIHDDYYDQALELAKNVEVKQKYPRICNVQTTRENYPVTKRRDYYRVKLTIPLLDHLNKWSFDFRQRCATCTTDFTSSRASSSSAIKSSTGKRNLSSLCQPTKMTCPTIEPSMRNWGCGNKDRN